MKHMSHMSLHSQLWKEEKLKQNKRGRRNDSMNKRNGQKVAISEAREMTPTLCAPGKVFMQTTVHSRLVRIVHLHTVMRTCSGHFSAGRLLKAAESSQLSGCLSLVRVSVIRLVFGEV